MKPLSPSRLSSLILLGALWAADLGLLAAPQAPLPGGAANPSPSLPGAPQGTNSGPTLSLPPLPGTRSPAATFRELLALGPAERAQALADRSEHQRKYLEGRLREYEALAPTEREARLRQLELTFHLDVLMKTAPDRRHDRMNAVPADLRPLIEERLKQWDLLPLKVQQEVLEHETTANYFLRVRADDAPNGAASVAQARTADRSSPAGQFHRFFELPLEERQKTLDTLPTDERQRMERTLKAFAALPPEQRRICVESFDKFSRMTQAQRDQFLKNAARWKAMSPRERETWRALVDILPPNPGVSLPPPLPSGAEGAGGPVTASSNSVQPRPAAQRE